ncbi:MAG: DUF1826 domain-containing protein [Planctomycetaceae bacterium]|nr:DUF1826 domain-containing protein [Planctomycetaceae bacterium]
MQFTTTEQIKAWDSVAATKFDFGTDDILVLERHPLASLESAIQAARVDDYRSMVNRETAAREVRFALAELQIQSPELNADIAGLALAFLDQFGLEEARLRVEITRTQSCPKFHCDNVHVRLITTYSGPTTEYVYAGEDATHAAPLQGLVFLKGHKHPTHRDSVHHRSPEVPDGEKRMCVILDY